jgi:hypothetical protein
LPAHRKDPTMTLSLEKSPRAWRDNSWARYFDPKANAIWTVPATSEDLIELRSDLRRAASIDHGRIDHLMGHVVASHLARIDHLIAVHLCGYEFRPDGRRDDPDWGSSCCAWKTGTGTYCGDAPRKWTTDTDLAADLASRYTPHLRLDLRIGGARHGQIRKAHFDDKHPDSTLAGQDVPLPAEWPRKVRSYPAIAIVDTFLTAFAMQKEAAAATCPELPSLEVLADA